MKQTMDRTDLERVALAFVERINLGDVGRLLEMMTEDHEFVDMTGDSFRGRNLMREAWTDYFRLFPDYTIQVEASMVNDSAVVLVGRSDGTLSAYGRQALQNLDGALPGELQGRAIWTARVREGRIAQWRVCPDTSTARRCLGIGEEVTA